MKRIWIAMSVFAAVISVCIYGYFSAQQKGQSFIELTQSCIYEAEENENADIVKLSDKIKKEWAKSSILFKLTFVQNDFTEIEYLLSSLDDAAKDENREQFCSSCLEAVYRLKFILDSEKPLPENIF